MGRLLLMLICPRYILNLSPPYNKTIPPTKRKHQSTLHVNGRFITQLDDAEIIELHKDFLMDCPSGQMRVEKFLQFYRACLQDFSKQIAFREFFCAISITTTAKIDKKLGWAFNMYDKTSYKMLGCVRKMLDAQSTTEKMMENLFQHWILLKINDFIHLWKYSYGRQNF